MSTPEENTQALHIIELISENVKRLRAINIRPDGRIITIGGDNDAGKSSVLQSIEMAIGGGDQIIDEPIRRGAKKARTVLNFGDIIVTRTYTKSGSTLTVTNKDGVPQKSPQELLNRLCSAVTFDPFGFTLLKPDKQKEVLQGIVKLDFTKLNADYQKHFADRTLVKRELDRQKALVASLPFHKDAPAAEESSTSVVTEIESAQTANNNFAGAQRLIVDADEEIGSVEAGLDAAKNEVSRLKAALADADGAVTERTADLAKAKETALKARAAAALFKEVDLTPLKAKLSGLEATNTKVRANKQRADAEAAGRSKQEQSDGLTRKLDDIEEKKQTMLREAKFPVAGLSFSEDGVLLDNLPFAQAGDAEQIRVSVAIAAALNPRIRVMLIKDGSLIGTKKMELIRQLAEKHNLQVWIEVVSDSTDKKSSVVIEDGHRVGEEVADEPEPTPESEQSATATAKTEAQPQFDLPPSR